MKKVTKLILSIVMFLSVLLVGCSESGKGSPKDESAGTKVGIIFTEAGLGGESFNDLAFEGVKKASEELGIEYNYVEPSSVSDQEIVQDEMAESGDYDLIIAVGQEQVDAIEVVAVDYPDQKFALIDASVDLPNVASYEFKESEGSFLVGALSALLKESETVELVGTDKVLGFIGGVESPLIEKFAAGFEAGARYIDDEYKVLVDYVGGFNDPSTAKVISETMYSQGADIQYHAAGASGTGMFQSAENNEFITIGVNSNQNTVAPDYIVASMLKLVNQAAYDSIEDVINDDFKPGVNVLGLEQEGIGYTLEKSNIEVPEDVVETVEELRNEIIKGEIKVPEKLEDIDGFIKNN